MKKSRIFILLVLSLAFALSLFACNEEPNEPMAKKLDTPSNIVASERTLSWTMVSHARSYQLRLGEDELPVIALSQLLLDGSILSYSLQDWEFGTYSISVRAVGDDSEYLDSDWSSAISHEIEPVATQGLLYTLVDGTYEVSKGTSMQGGNTKIIIPSKHKGVAVTRIAKDAFRSQSTLAEVTLGKNIEHIGEYAFYETAITKIALPSGIKTIGNYAFFSCIYLTEAVIPPSVTSIGEYAYVLCLSLSGFVVDEANQNFRSTDGVLFDKNMTRLIFYPGDKAGGYAVPQGVTAIGAAAFYHCTKITSLTVASSVVEVGVYAFYYCNGLTIYSEAPSATDGWVNQWNYSGRPVVWNCTLSAQKDYVVSLARSLNSISNASATGGVTAPYRSGYDFGGWSITAGDTTVAFSAENVASSQNGTTLHAIWTQA